MALDTNRHHKKDSMNQIILEPAHFLDILISERAVLSKHTQCRVYMKES